MGSVDLILKHVLLMNSDTYAILNSLVQVLYPIFISWESSGGCVGSWGVNDTEFLNASSQSGQS